MSIIYVFARIVAVTSGVANSFLVVKIQLFKAGNLGINHRLTICIYLCARNVYCTVPDERSYWRGIRYQPPLAEYFLDYNVIVGRPAVKKGEGNKTV